MTDGAAADRDRYTVSQRAVHWLVALLVLGNLAGGATLWALGFSGLRESFGLAVTNAVYTGHKTAGILLLGLMLVRLGLRWRHGAPAKPASMSTAVWHLARANHAALYVLLLVMPGLGWAATAAGGFPVQFFAWNLPGLVPENEALANTLFTLHGAVGLAILALAAVHVAGALRHRFVLQDGVLRRIALP